MQLDFQLYITCNKLDVQNIANIIIKVLSGHSLNFTSSQLRYCTQRLNIAFCALNKEQIYHTAFWFGILSNLLIELWSFFSQVISLMRIQILEWTESLIG